MIERFTVPFEPGMDERVISAHLPEDYENSGARYPVMYMFDGQNAFESQSDDYGGTWNLHRFLMCWEKEIIVIAVQSSGEADRRMAEYSPYPLHEKRWGAVRAHGDETARWLADVLKPRIDARYRTMPRRECTGVMGGSMGALMSLYAVTARNDVFSKAACVSPACRDVCEAILQGLNGCVLSPDTRVYLSMGEDEERDKHLLKHCLVAVAQLEQIGNVG